MCIVSHGLGETSTSPVIAPHSRVHTSHGCLDLHGHISSHSPHTAVIWGIHAAGAPWEGPGEGGVHGYPGSHVVPSTVERGGLHHGLFGGYIQAPTLHNLGHPHMHFPLWKVVKVITRLTTPVCKLMQNCDPSHTPLFTC